MQGKYTINSAKCKPSAGFPATVCKMFKIFPGMAPESAAIPAGKLPAGMQTAAFYFISRAMTAF